MIPITKVDVSDSESLVLEVLRSGNLAQGTMVARLEEAFAEIHEVRHCIAVNNGTTALVAALQVCNLEIGQEVITSPFTFVATLNSILEVGGTVRFVDISAEDFCISTDAVANAINNNTAVIMPVHLYGQSADMNSLSQIAERHQLMIVEDAAQAHGAKFENTYVGNFGIGCFSLYATKNITSAEGGLITTNDSVIAERLRILRNQGMKERYQYVMQGHNYRMTDIHAAIAIPQVAKISDIGNRRNANAAYLSKHLSSIKGVRIPTAIAKRHHVWHQYTILIEDNASVSRDEFIYKMTESGVNCGSYYPKLAFDYECFRNNPNIQVDNVSVASRIAQQCVSLPVHQFLTSDDLEKIVLSCNTILN